ncbi:MAG: ATP-grasp domain-containing protein, partial [Candidatus Altiarchaeota archaeon]
TNYDNQLHNTLNTPQLSCGDIYFNLVPLKRIMQHVITQKLALDEKKAYLLYIGELKTLTLCDSLLPLLSEKYERTFETIAITPDVRSSYDGIDNLIVINPLVKSLKSNITSINHVRIPQGIFYQSVSESGLVAKLCETLSKTQDKIPLYVYGNDPSLSIQKEKIFEVIAPDPVVSERYNNKVLQLIMAREKRIPMPEGVVAETFEEACTLFKEKKSEWGKIFCSAEFSAGGERSLIASSIEEIKDKFRFLQKDSRFLLTHYYDTVATPSVLGIIANSKEIFVANVVDQMIMGTAFRGSIYPSNLPYTVQEDARAITRRLGRIIAKDGYRGAFGADFIVTDDEDVYFIEINARKQGTTQETEYAMKHIVPLSNSFVELEYQALTEGHMVCDIEEIENALRPKNAPFHWATYNVKTLNPVSVLKDAGIHFTEAVMFGRYRANQGSTRAVIMDHVGKNVVVHQGFIGRTAAIGETREKTLMKLKEAKELIYQTLSPKDQLRLRSENGGIP